MPRIGGLDTRIGPGGGIRIGIERTRVGADGGWFNDPAFADLAAVGDFNNWRFAITTVPLASVPTASVAELCVKRACTAAEFFAFAASSTTARTYTDANGVLRNDLSVDQLRQDWANGKRQLALNGQSTNSIRNNTMQGAVGGTYGSTAVNPTNWISNLMPSSGATGVQSSSVVSGVDFIFADISGASPVVTASVWQFDGAAVIAASPGQVWTASVYTQLLSGSLSAGFTSFDLVLREHDSGGAFIRQTLVSIQASDANVRRFSNTVTLGASTAFVTAGVRANYNGSAVAFKLGLGLPQLEQNLFASPVMKTSGTAATRAIETARLSPTLEAILQRSAASVVVRGQNLLRAAGGAMVGGDVSPAGGVRLLGTNGANTAISVDGSTAVSTGAGSALGSNSWAGALGFDGTGRSIVRNGGTLFSDAGTVPGRSNVHMGRGTVVQGYGDGWYDFLGIAPSRLSDARLTALAVAA